MASLIQRIERIEAARAQAAEKAQSPRLLDPLSRALRLMAMYARASTTDPATPANRGACRVRALVDAATDRAGLPRLSAASLTPLRVVNTTDTRTPGPSAADVHAHLERQAQRNEAELFSRLQTQHSSSVENGATGSPQTTHLASLETALRTNAFRATALRLAGWAAEVV